MHDTGAHGATEALSVKSRVDRIVEGCYAPSGDESYGTKSQPMGSSRNHSHTMLIRHVYNSRFMV